MEDNNKKEELTLRERISEDPFFLINLLVSEKLPVRSFCLAVGMFAKV